LGCRAFFFIAFSQGVLSVYWAYVTRYAIHALQPTGADLEKFSEAMHKQVDWAIDGFLIAGCQIALIVFVHRLSKTGAESRPVTGGAR